MKIILTGGAGFIGGHAYDHFTEQGDDVVVVDKLSYAADISSFQRIKKLEIFDICETERLSNLVKDFRPDIIVNFAAETHVDNSINSSKEFIVSNVIGTTSVLDVCVKHSVGLCHVSTDEVYGPARNHAFIENDSLNPMNPYSATKAAADLMISAYRNTHKLKCFTVRPSNNFGPRQYPEKLIPKLLQCILLGKRFPIYGDGSQEREWTYVKDTVLIIRKLLDKWVDGDIYNISSGLSMRNLETILAIIEAYNTLNGSNIKIDDVVEFVKDRKGHDKKYWINSQFCDSRVEHKYTESKNSVMETVKSFLEIKHE
jgi:dTDP-glucose 4,6-dehydratase